MSSYDSVVQSLKHGDILGAVQALINHALSATRIVHTPVVVPLDAQPNPGVGPTPVALGDTTLGLHYDLSTEKAYRTYRIPAAYSGNAMLHVHWTKAVDTNESGKTVRWRLTYKVFDGLSEEITAGSQILEFDDTYDDAGTTTRVVYQTPELAALAFVPTYFMSLKIEYVPAGTTLSGGPVLISVDLVYSETINSDDQI